MTTPVLKSVRPDAWPDLIHAGKAVVRFPNGIESGSWYNRTNDEGDKTAEYIRRDPAVLAELPEVQRLVAAACEIAADIIESPDTADMTRGEVAQGIRERAAAIREGRNG